jgi:hypothetical protein
LQLVTVDTLRNLLKAGGLRLDFVFVSACHSKETGQAFVDAGVCMYVNMYVYVCMCVYVYMFMYICRFTARFRVCFCLPFERNGSGICRCRGMNICEYVCLCMYICICSCIYVDLRLDFVFVSACHSKETGQAFVDAGVCMYVNMYVYVCMCVYIYIFMYICRFTARFCVCFCLPFKRNGSGICRCMYVYVYI